VRPGDVCCAGSVPRSKTARLICCFQCSSTACQTSLSARFLVANHLNFVCIQHQCPDVHNTSVRYHTPPAGPADVTTTMQLHQCTASASKAIALHRLSQTGELLSSSGLIMVINSPLPPNVSRPCSTLTVTISEQCRSEASRNP
jgi:hypothetical protein